MREKKLKQIIGRQMIFGEKKLSHPESTDKV